MRTFVSGVPLFPVALVLATVAAAILAPGLGRRLGTRARVAFLLVASLGLVASATLLPTAGALSGMASDGICDLSRIGLPSVMDLRASSDTRLNLLLFVPLGAAVALLPRRPTTAVVVLGACLLPFLVEGIQLSFPVLGRGCQSADIVDNLTGLGLGLVLGLLVRFVVGPERFHR